MEWWPAGRYDAFTMDSTTIDLSPDLASDMPELDLARRHELRTFLKTARAGLGPSDVGLPQTMRRRVPGLRRGEVAELIGVTVDWYRSFEAGRSVRVSPQLLSRLIAALRMSSLNALALFQLAIPEMYLTTRQAIGNSQRETWMRLTRVCDQAIQSNHPSSQGATDVERYL